MHRSYKNTGTLDCPNVLGYRVRVCIKCKFDKTDTRHRKEVGDGVKAKR